MKNSVLVYIQNFFIIFLFMYLLFPFKFVGTENIFRVVYYGYVFYGLYKISRLIKKCHKGRNILIYFWVIYALLLFISIIIPFFYGTNDYSFFAHLFDRLVVIICFSVSVFLCDDIGDFCKKFSFATALYVIFSLVFLIIPQIKNAYMDIVVYSEISSHIEDNIDAMYLTRFGLQGFSGFEHTVCCSISVLFCLFQYVNPENVNKKKQIIIVGLLNFIGTCMYGRAGMLCALTLVLIFMVKNVIINGKYYLILVYGLFSIGIVFIFNLLFEEIQKIDYLNWIFEPFINLKEENNLRTASSDGLKTMYISLSDNTILYGDGYYTKYGSYYKGIDVGYIRPILFWGIFGSLIYYSCFLVLSFYIHKYFQKRTFGYIIILLVCMNFFYELKGEIVLAFIKIIYPMLLIIVFEQNMVTHIKIKSRYGKKIHYRI